MELKKDTMNIVDLKSKPIPKTIKTPMTFNNLRDSCFRYRGVLTETALIVRPGNDGSIEVCGEVIWKVREAGLSYIGLSMYDDPISKEKGFSDVVKVLELPEHMKGCEVDKGIGQIMYQNSENFKRFGFTDLMLANDDTYLDISWRQHFRKAGYSIVHSHFSKPL